MEIKVIDYTKKIKNHVILSNVNMEFEGGKVYGIKGKNGSGKTMLLRAITGLIRPTSGYVEIDGKRIGEDITFPEDVGALIENPGFLPGYTGRKNLQVLANIRNVVSDSEIDAILEKVGLGDVADKKYRTYSLGMKQKLGIAGALFEHPKLIILDEPTNALDESSVRMLRGLLEEYKSRDRIIILTCHDSEELEFLSDEIFVMENGERKI